jgi:hypothetical protein
MKSMRVLFVVGIFILAVYGCASNPTTVRECVPSASLPSEDTEGILLVGKVGSNGDILLWQTLNLKTGTVEPFDVLNRPDKESILPPSWVSDVIVSPSGRWIAYITSLVQHGYYIQSRDGSYTRFVSPQNYVIVYTREQENREWFLQEMDARSVERRLYPFMPNKEERGSGVLIKKVESEWLAQDWLAYSGTKQIPTLVIASSDGKETFYFPDWNNEWQGIKGWFNEEYVVLINHAGADVFDPTTFQIPANDRIILFEPFTGEKLISGDTYPGMVLSSLPAIYSPSMRYVAYLNTDKSSLIIWDRIENKVVAQTSAVHISPSLWPLWIDESTLVYAATDIQTNKEDWFSLDVTGKSKRLTELVAAKYSEISSIFPPQLSPDKRFLAFGATDSTDRISLLILDTREYKTYDFCVKFDKQSNREIRWTWLHVQNRLVVSASQVDKTHIQLLDVMGKKVFHVSIMPGRFVIVGSLLQK